MFNAHNQNYKQNNTKQMFRFRMSRNPQPRNLLPRSTWCTSYSVNTIPD